MFAFVQQALKAEGRSKIYVHCEMGCSRAATVMIAIIRHFEISSLQAAYNYVKHKRPWIAPNPGFLEQLRVFLDNH